MSLENQIESIIAKDDLLKVIMALPSDAEFAFVSFHKEEKGEMAKIRYSSNINVHKLHFAGHWIANYALKVYDYSL